MANEGEIPLPSTPEEHLYLFVRGMGDVLASAYGRMQHPMLQGLKDRLFFDNVMVSVGRLRKAMEARETPEGPSGKHIDMVVSRERVAALGDDLKALLDIANAVGEKGGLLADYNEKVKAEVDDIEQLSATLHDKTMAEIRGEPVPPLEAKHEELLMKLWDKYSDRIDQSPGMQMYRVTAARADEVTPGIGALFEEKKRSFEEHAVAQVAILDYMAANNEIINSLVALHNIRSAALGIVGNYLGMQAEKSGEDLPPKG